MSLAGIGTLSIFHYARANAEGDYANALYVAEAEINYEFNKITKNAALADPAGSGSGTTYTFGAGSCSVYVTNLDGTPWTTGSQMYVYSKGTVNGISRALQVSGKPTGLPQPDCALFGVAYGIINHSGATVLGDVGTNGFFTFNNGPTVTGYVDFNGAGSNWTSNPSQEIYNVRYRATPLLGARSIRWRIMLSRAGCHGWLLTMTMGSPLPLSSEPLFWLAQI